jgi:small subunit ribosomal protein S6
MATATGSAQKKYAREYETIYIMQSAVDPDEADRVASKLAEVVSRLDGKLTKVDNWGKRRLAYNIKKNTRGVFVYLKYVGYQDMVAEIERNLRMTDSVIRFQTIQVGEELIKEDVAVDPEEVKFRRLEQTEEEEEASLEQKLGLVAPPVTERSEDDLEGDFDDDLDPVAAPDEPVAPAAEDDKEKV